MFQPVIPMGGIVGWQFLQRTQESQQQAFASSATVRRDTADFSARIATVETPEALVEDYRLLNVALGAFGLSEDIGNKYFVRKVLSEGTEDPAALANRLSDTRYLALAEAFSFGEHDRPSNTLGAAWTQIADGIGSLPERARSEARAGVTALFESLQALSATLGTEAPEAQAARRDEVQALWPAVMENRAISEAVRGALGVAEGFGSLDQEVQIEVIRQKLAGLLEGRPVSLLTDFASRITADYITRRFEAAVGEQNPDLRLALNLQRELPQLAAQDSQEDTMWLRVMGNKPLRTVFEKAFGLPAAFGAIDLDKQLETFKDRAAGTFGESSVTQFTDPAKLEELTRLFLTRPELTGGSTVAATGNSAALTILSNVSSGNLFSLLA